MGVVFTRTDLRALETRLVSTNGTVQRRGFTDVYSIVFPPPLDPSRQGLL